MKHIGKSNDIHTRLLYIMYNATNNTQVTDAQLSILNTVKWYIEGLLNKRNDETSCKP